MLIKIRKYSSPNTDGKVRKIINGENLEVLDGIKSEYLGGVKCVYIDPPYNNGESYSHYDDRKHGLWLSGIKDRLVSLRDFLSEDGSIWISIDDGEVHYLKVAADEIFGRKNFITTVIWQQRTTRENRRCFSNNHEYILVYAKNKAAFSLSVNKLEPTTETLSRYKNPDNDPRGPWQSISVNVQAGHAVKSQFYEVVSPSGIAHVPPNGRCWAYNRAKMDELIKQGRVWFGKNGNCVPRLKKYLIESKPGLTPETLWLAEDVGTNKEAKKHLLKIFSREESIFDTPKPERLIKRILEVATNEGDLVLDAYLGAGATVAVAHKMRRQYIGIDKGEHIVNFVVKRQKMILKGMGEGVLERRSDRGEGFEFFTFKR